MSTAVILGLMTFLFLFFAYLGVPVAFSLLAGVFIGAMFTDVTFPALIQKMFDGMDSEALLAIPFFLLVGELMSSANVVGRITTLSLALVGHIRGGLAQVVTVFSMFFSEMSGSTSADVAVISRALGGPMKKEGYDPAFTAAIIAAASTIAALVPPSITAVVYGAVGNVSIAGLFMAGVVPGFMIGFGLMIYCYFFGPRGLPRPRAAMREVAGAFQGASLPLMIPFILLGGILTGWFTHRSWRCRSRLDFVDSYTQLKPPTHEIASLRFLFGGFDIFTTAHHHRRSQRFWLDAGLFARGHHHCRVDHQHRRQ